MEHARLPGPAVTAVGGLPHRDARRAAAFSLRHMDIPTVPSLPRRSPAENVISQALVGLSGVTVGQYGSIAVDADRLDPTATIATDLSHDAFVGLRAFLRAADGYQGWITWQCSGPVSLGLCLVRAGSPPAVAFDVAMHAVRARLTHLHAAIAEALPSARQLVMLHEPAYDDLMEPGFPIAPDVAVDLVSGALAAIEDRALMGLHACGGDLPSMLAAGPGVLAVGAGADFTGSLGYLVRFIERGGTIAWGAVPTSGPVSASPERPWRWLCDRWCAMVQHGADPVQVRTASLITPDCGLGMHPISAADRVFFAARGVADRAKAQALASQWSIGA